MVEIGSFFIFIYYKALKAFFTFISTFSISFAPTLKIVPEVGGGVIV